MACYHVDTLIGFVGMQVVLDEATITNIVIIQGSKGKDLPNVYGKWRVMI